MQSGMKAAVLAVLSVTACLAAGAVPVDTSAEARKALQANYNDRDAAVARRDVDGALAHYAPEFVGVSTAGKAHNLKEERAEFVKTFATLNPRTSETKTTITRLTLTKGASMAAADVRRHGVLVLVNPQTKGSDVLVLDGAYQDTWAKRAGAWRLAREQTLSLHATMNGRPL